VKPITPEEIEEATATRIPDVVYEVVNEQIAKNWRGNSATIRQDAIVTALIRRPGTAITKQQIFDGHWLDFEDAYREVGWEVVYDGPGYSESYPATFKFTRPR
jgi:DNA-binding response OmpR family regulator